MVDSECRDTKCEQTTAFLTSLLQGVGGSNAEGAITIDGDPLSHILAQDNTVMDCQSSLTGADNESSEVDDDVSSRLTETELKVCATARQHFSRKAGKQRVSMPFGECTNLMDAIQATVTEYGCVMKQEKKNKCPRSTEEDEGFETSPRKRHALLDPHINVTDLLDSVHFDPVYTSEMTHEEVMATVEDIHTEFSLDQNKEQSRAFRITAEHFAFNTMKQMLLFITGIGGSGKSHVIKAIVALFKRCGCPQNLLLSAPTGSAVVLIDRYTIHALTFLPGGDIKRNQLELENIWGKVHYLILDEVSMVSGELLCQISEWIAARKRSTCDAMSKPFRGVNVIFAGDMGQLRLVGSAALYSSNLLSTLAASKRETLEGHRALFGTFIWQQLTHVIKLKKNFRTVQDPQYIDLLNRIRIGKGTVSSDDGPSNYEILKTHTLDKLRMDCPNDYQVL